MFNAKDARKFEKEYKLIDMQQDAKDALKKITLKLLPYYQDDVNFSIEKLVKETIKQGKHSFVLENSIKDIFRLFIFEIDKEFWEKHSGSSYYSWTLRNKKFVDYCQENNIKLYSETEELSISN